MAAPILLAARALLLGALGGAIVALVDGGKGVDDSAAGGTKVLLQE